jgi:hypothetical protein
VFRCALYSAVQLANMNTLHVGFFKSINLPKGGFLLFDDEVRDIPRSRVFDLMKHSFNPLKGIEYKRARELAELFYTISPRGTTRLRFATASARCSERS